MRCLRTDGLHQADGILSERFRAGRDSKYRRQGVTCDPDESDSNEGRSAGKKGMILTCKDRLIHYHERNSATCTVWDIQVGTRRGAVWYDMLEF